MDWHIIVGGVAGAMSALAVIPYIKDILHGQTRPNIFSWLLWVVLLLIAVLAQVSAGASWSLIFLIGDLIGTSTIFILCLVGYGYKEYGRLEWTCLVLAILAIVSWQATNQPVLAILFAVVADALASLPTIVKAYKDPLSEAPTQFLIIASAGLLAVISSTKYDTANLIFPAYLFSVNAIIGVTAVIRKRTLTLK